MSERKVTLLIRIVNRKDVYDDLCHCTKCIAILFRVTPSGRAALESKRSNAAFSAAFLKFNFRAFSNGARINPFERAFLRGAGNSCLVDPVAHNVGKKKIQNGIIEITVSRTGLCPDIV
jgi:hypothetical protein